MWRTHETYEVRVQINSNLIYFRKIIFILKNQLHMHRRTQHKDELKYKCIFAKWGMAFEDKQTLKSHIEGMHPNYMNLSKNLEEKELCYNDKVTQIWSGIRHKNVLDTLFSTEEILLHCELQKVRERRYRKW